MPLKDPKLNKQGTAGNRKHVPLLENLKIRSTETGES
jgi:hypothetical protein